MRANFTASLAAVSASNYVAGVGDRHLQVRDFKVSGFTFAMQT